jgi:type VI secretion system secreted protein Hcp
MKRIPNSIIPLAFATLATIQSTADAAAYIKYDGIKGEVTAKGHEGEIELTSWSWELSQSADPRSPIIRPIGITKEADSTTPKLHEVLLSGSQAASATLTMTKTATDQILDYMIIDMTNVSVSTAGISSGGDRPVESYSLTFDSYCITYITQDPTGASVPVGPTCWEFK